MLFNNEEVYSKIDFSGFFGESESIEMDVLRLSVKPELLEYSEQFKSKKALHFVTFGDFSMPDLLKYCIAYSGKCNVWMSSWAISENAARILFSLHQDNLIGDFYGIFDFVVERKNSSAINLLNSFAKGIKITECHAKVMVLESEHDQITIMSSANFNDNPRIEIGCIFKDKVSAEFHKNWITNELNK